MNWVRGASGEKPPGCYQGSPAPFSVVWKISRWFFEAVSNRGAKNTEVI